MSLAPGLYFQVYRDAIRGSHSAALLAALDKWADSPSVKGVVLHSVNLEMSEAEYEPLAKLVHARGLAALASFGLGDERVERTGKAIARFAKREDCAAAVFDMEGAWENEPDDRDDARRLFDAFRADAPDAFAADQPWFVPTVHSRFPWPETATAIDLRCPQVYCNDFKGRWGRQRYARVELWHSESWATMERRWRAAGMPIRPRSRTIQGYGWQDIPADLVDCLLVHAAAAPVIVWCDPFPAPDFLRGLQAVDALREQGGYTGPNAVLDFQRWSNANDFLPLKEDNRCGEKTLAALGVS